MPRYNSIENIPAKVFFEILKTKNYQLLRPKPKEKGLKAIFTAIYDDFFVKSDNKEAQRYLEITKELAFIELYKIPTIKRVLYFLMYNTTTQDMRRQLLKALREGCGIEIDENTVFIDEVLRILQVEVGIIQNDFNFLKLELDEMVKGSQKKDFDYYENLGVLSHLLPNNTLVREDMTLMIYVTLEKLSKSLNKKQHG